MDNGRPCDKFEVIWEDEAIDELTDAWCEHFVANQPFDVDTASRYIDRLLARSAERYGSPLSEGLYKLDVPPLRVFFSVDRGRCVVKVTRLCLSPRGR